MSGNSRKGPSSRPLPKGEIIGRLPIDAMGDDAYRAELIVLRRGPKGSLRVTRLMRYIRWRGHSLRWGSIKAHGHLEEGSHGGIQVQQLWFGKRGQV